MRYGGLVVIAAAIGAVYGVVAYDMEVAGFLSRSADLLFQLFEDKEFPLLLAGGLMAVAGSFLVVYLLAVILPKVLHLQSIKGFLARYNDEIKFAETFPQISARLKKSPLIGHAWSEFEETLVLPEGDRAVVQNTTRPHAFINYSCAQDRSLALRLMPHIPNYFVGVGLLLTFVGLVAALNFANEAVGGDVEEAVDGLQDLLAAATFKFWTSIAGLAASIILSFFFRLFGLWVEGQFTEVCQAIERGMAFSTPQRIFVDVRDTIEQQLEETKKINTDVAMSIADGVGRQFQEHVPGMLADAMKPLVASVQELTEKVGRGTEDGVGKMVEQFANQIEGSAGKHMQEMAGTLQSLQESLESMQGSMNSSGDEFARRMAEGSENLDKTMQEVAAAMRELIDSLREQLGTAGESFGASLEESLQKLTQQSEAMATAMAEQSRGASEAFSEEIAKAAQALSAAANDSATQSASIAEELREKLGSGVSGVQGGLERLSLSLESLDTQLETQGRAMAEVAAKSREAASAMSDAADGVQSGLGPFQEVGRTMAESSRRLEASTSEIAQRIEAAVQAVESVSKDLSSLSETTSEMLETYEERFEGVDEDLEKAFTSLHQAVVDQQKQVQDFVQKLDASFEKALSNLSGGVDGIQSTVDELVEALEKMNPRDRR